MYDFKGKSDWQGGHADTSDYGYPDNGVFFGKIQSVFFNENVKQDGTVTVSLSITATNDSYKQKVTFSIPYYNKARTSLSVLATQLLFLRGFDTDNLNITATALTNKDGQQVLNKRTNQPVYMLPELEGTEFICLLKKNGGKTNADGTFTPYFNVYGWNFYNSFGFSVLEIKTGNKTTYPPLNMGATINLDHDKLLKEIEQDKLRAQAQAQQFKNNGFTGQQPQQPQPQQFGQQQPAITPPPVQPRPQQPAYNPPVPPQYANEPRHLDPLPPLPGTSPINRPTEQQVNQQFNQATQYDNDPLPF
jgi:hypothetical protein